MALTPGAKLGPYEIQSPLGAGGMGEVYRATQSSLGRQVAIKVLASAAASDPVRLQRFEQEARSASALNHPNIISIYDVGRENSTSYIAMEFVDGKTLRGLLDAGPLGIKKALQIATQIADGLAKAHAAGIVHRDLKPENVMVTRDGFVKILDFGLAKLMPSGFESSSQTLTAALPATHPGMVMGTAGYMSPEQARGANIDYRSDIFSFGSILYEMVAGKQPFKAASSAQTLAAIIEDDPTPVSEANPKTPTPLRWIIERCLAKDPDDRYSSTRDLARDLQSVRDHLSDATTSGQMPQAARPTQRPKWLAPALIALSGMLLGGALVAWLRPQPVASSPTLRYLTFSGTDFAPSVSPDGRTVAFVSGRDGTSRIWLKQLESGSETVLTPGPEDDSPHFSPDGGWILFIHNRAAYRIPSIGGEPRKLLDDVDDAGWSPDGRQIAFVRIQIGSKNGTEIGVATVPDGAARVIHQVDNENLHAPSWSPDGSAIVLSARRNGTAGIPVHSLLLLSPDGRNVRKLKCPLPGGELSAASWAGGNGQVVYEVPESAADVGGRQTTSVGSAGHVLLQDVKTGRVRTLFGVQAPVSSIEVAGPGRLIFDALTQHGNLKYYSSAPGESSAGRWLTRGNSIDRQPYHSPDGKTIIFSSSRSGDVDIWEVSTNSNALRRLTDHPAADWDPFVTADNQHLLWSSNRTGNFEIWIAERDGSSPRQLTHDGFDAENPVVTPDGWVLYASGQPQHPGMWKVRLDGSDARLVVSGPAAWPDVSPDGKYALYHVVASISRTDIHIVRLADGTPVEFHAGGQRARFAGDGHSIVYIRNRVFDIVRQDFLSGPGAPITVLVPVSPDLNIDTFHITPDGHSMVVSYTQPSRSLVVADGVSEVASANPSR
jgi:eukaryotic-like serine/threonine-protein kinase